MKLPFKLTINFVAVYKFIKKYILRKKPVQKMNFGLVRDREDVRDFVYKAKLRAEELPESTEMKNISRFPFRFNQGHLGSCVGNAVSAGFIMSLITNKQVPYNPSRLFAYFNAREDDQKGEDAGASIRNGIKGVVTFGLCHEETWPYNISKFTVTPPLEAYQEGQDHQAITYERIYPVTKEAIMDAVHQGYAVVYGKRLFESFLSDAVKETGIIPVPKTCWEDEVGGHAMVILDYERDNTIELNSWGDSWGFNGACRVPWKYVLDPKLCFDFWVIYQAESEYSLKTSKKRKK